MGKKLGVFTVMLVLVLIMAHEVEATTYELRVDLALRIDPPEGESYPLAATFKGAQAGHEDEGWIAWTAFKDSEPHDARGIDNLGGSGIDVYISNGRGNSNNVFMTDLTGEPLCNTWLESKYKSEGSPGGNCHLVLTGPGLAPGNYWLRIYHNSIGQSEANMPTVSVQTYCEGSEYNDNHPPYDDDCLGVIAYANDVNVAIQSETLDDNLNVSEVAFYTDGSPVWIRMEAAPDDMAIMNAFILELSVPQVAYGPDPAHEEEFVCPGGILAWGPGELAVSHNVYLGTDWDDVNDATTAVDPNNVFKGNETEPNYDPPGLLELGGVYYWRIDEVNVAEVNSPWKGNVWEFTVEEGKARNPSPADGTGSLSFDAKDLTWTASCIATTHDVYFGQNFADVNDGTTSSASYQGEYGVTWNTGALAVGRQYFWRIDGHTSLGIIKGDVWNFQTTGFPIMWLKFDGELGADINTPVTDWTGNVTFYVQGGGEATLKYGEPNPLVNTGGTSAEFITGNNDGSSSRHLWRNHLGTEDIDLAGSEYTIEMWVRQDVVCSENDSEDDFAATLIRRYDKSYVLGIDNDGVVRYVHGGYDEGDGFGPNVLYSEPGVMGLGEWHHIAAVFDSAEAELNEKLYVDGVLVDDNNKPGPNPDDDDDYLTIGGRWLPPRESTYPKARNFFHGLIDELRITGIALSPNQFLIRGNPNLAWLPIPYDFANEVAPDTDLLWNPGDYASSHDVYLGTDWDDVNDATTASAGIFRDNYEPNSYDPGDLLMDAGYYWRIDEVNDSNGTKWKGRVWRFKTAAYFLIDDMESYNLSDNEIYDTWIEDGSAWLDLGYGGDPAVSGEQSMYFLYFNNVNYGGGYYSEVGKALGGSNWTARGVKVLTVFFYGDPDNAAGSTEEPYVGLYDGGTYAEVRYTADGNNLLSDLLEEEWHEWNMVLADFTSVDLSSVDSIYFGAGQRGSGVVGGIGELFVDDFRIYGPKCVPEFGPLWDWSGNCIVDLTDVGVMADEWLRADAQLDVSVPGTVPVAHWELDDFFWMIEDSAGTNDGIAEGEYSWVEGKVGDYAIEFTGDGGRVRVPHSSALMPDSNVSVAAWIHATESISYSARVVAKGVDANNWEAYYIQFTDEDHVSWSVRDANHNNHAIETGDLNRNEWIHVAGTWDGDVLKLYINGQLDEQDTVGDFVGNLLQDSNDLSIGNASDVNNRAFIGKIDDVRVYDYGLNALEVAYVATALLYDGYVGLESQVNIYDEEDPGEKAVNFRDLALLMTKWLEQKLWP